MYTRLTKQREESEMSQSIWRDGVMGVATGDALGCPVQFLSREEVAKNPVTGMRGDGTFHLPAGSWTDDTSLTLALLDSIRENRGVDLKHIMECFIKWLYRGEYTPFGEAFDIGFGVRRAIQRYKVTRNPKNCGGSRESDCGNGSLMRILPICLFARGELLEGRASEEEAVGLVQAVGGLTHAHICANIGCGLYFFLARAVLDEGGRLNDRLAKGLQAGFAFYERFLADHEFLEKYSRLRDFGTFSSLPPEKIKSTGYVVDTLEAALWSLSRTDSFQDALLVAVNLGLDADTVGAVAGGLAGLFYGYDAIPADWLAAIKGRDWIEGLCDACAEELKKPDSK